MSAVEIMGPTNLRLLEDAIDALSWSTPGPPDCMTTKSAAAIVGCDVVSAWNWLHELACDYSHLREWAPGDSELAGRWRAADIAGHPPDVEVMASVIWSLEEDPWSEEDDWYRHRIEAATRIGSDAAVEYWKAEAERSSDGGQS